MSERKLVLNLRITDGNDNIHAFSITEDPEYNYPEDRYQLYAGETVVNSESFVDLRDRVIKIMSNTRFGLHTPYRIDYRPDVASDWQSITVRDYNNVLDWIRDLIDNRTGEIEMVQAYDSKVTTHEDNKTDERMILNITIEKGYRDPFTGNLYDFDLRFTETTDAKPKYRLYTLTNLYYETENRKSLWMIARGMIATQFTWMEREFEFRKQDANFAEHIPDVGIHAPYHVVYYDRSDKLMNIKTGSSETVLALIEANVSNGVRTMVVKGE